MSVYPVDVTLEQARAVYFEANGFGADGGYESSWVDFKLGPIPFPFPNTPPRKRAVRFHDSREYGPELLALDVGTAQRELRLDRDDDRKATLTDKLLYALALVVGWITGLISFVLFVPLAAVAWPFLNWAASRRKRLAGEPSGSAEARSRGEPA